MKRTTNGVGGTLSLSRPSATASFWITRDAVAPMRATTDGRINLITIGAMPSGACRSAKKAMPMPPVPMRRSSR
jgi:hypothetical protein